ncbi:MAG: site-2 protease family protein [Planctomycetota bacterium]|jgi:regulator of sigma E protease
MTAILATILGIGFLLLIHEAGHYFAARAAGIRVEVFALGFGPRLFGFRRGDTDFRIALLPLGGYVKVSGEDPTRPPRPGDLFAATVQQRLLFYAGGIILNFLFAFLLLPALFLVGVPFEAPLLGTVNAGGAAWEAGMRPGERVLEIDGRRINGFRDIATGVALADAGETLPMVVVDAAGNERRLEVTPDFDHDRGFPQLGIGPLFDLVPVPGGRLAEALPKGAELVSVDGTPLDDPQVVRLLMDQAMITGATLQLGWRDGDGLTGVAVWQPEPADLALLPPQLGVLQMTRAVAAVRGPLADRLQPGEVLLRAGDRPVQRPEDLLLASLAGGMPELEVRGLDGTVRTVAADPSLDLPTLAASLALEAEAEAPYAMRAGGAAAAAGMLDGDRILRAGRQAVHDLDSLREVISQHAATAVAEPLTLMVARDGETSPINLEVVLAPVPAYDYDLAFLLRQETVRSANPLAAIGMGLSEAKSMVTEVFLTLQRMVTGEIDRKNLGGIISIGQITHTMASNGLIPLLFFLCLISVNLGVLNLLPIPALDGGHILFALIELVRRKPVSMQVQAAFQVIGVFVVLALILFVTTMDIQRLMS